MKNSVFHFVLCFCLPIFVIGELVSLYKTDAVYAARKATRNGKMRIGRSGGLKTSTQTTQEVKESVNTNANSVQAESAPAVQSVKKTASITDEDDDIKISNSSSSVEISKLKRERDDLKKQVNNLTTQKAMQKKSNQNNSKTAMCLVVGGKSKLIDMKNGVKSQEQKRDRILESVEKIEKEIKELDNWIAENKVKRDEIKAKAEKARVAQTVTGVAAIGAGVGAGAMYMKNKQLKSEEAEAKAGPQINTQGLSSGGLSLQNLAGKIDPGKVMEMGKGLIGGKNEGASGSSNILDKVSGVIPGAGSGGVGKLIDTGKGLLK